jgi:hypothetical protein
MEETIMADLANSGYVYTESTENGANFIASAVGLIAKTCQVPASLGVQDGDRKIVPAGTVIPANDATAIGILVNDMDVTHGDTVGAVYTAGHLYGNYLPAVPAAAAITALSARGLYFDDLTSTTGSGT